ncbi:MAG: N-acetylmuramoyl-L-alanine amidase [Lachnospiraceae bacterium]|nr:N-acetylmuramoyl-L-alanine amidase [Lachnospiraceae bacterium]
MNEEQLLRRLAGYSFAVMVLTICLSFAIRYKEEYDVLGQERDATRQEEMLYVEATPTMVPEVTVYPLQDTPQDRHAVEEEVWEVWQMISQESMAELEEQVGSRSVLIKKPAGTVTEWKMTENLPYYTITFTLHGAEENLNAASVLRMWDGTLYYGLPEEEEILKEFAVLSYEEEDGVTTEVSLKFDLCYVPEVTEQEEYYIINLKKYSEVYDKIVVIDAGHGGKDPGAGAENYRVAESDIALKLLLYLKEYLETNTDIHVFCTRTEDVYPTLQERADLALGLEADLFISWHCNAAETTRKNGTEVIFNAEQGREDTFNSRKFAERCLEKLVKALGTKDGGISNRQDLHIVRRATMPVVLIETAYLSNSKDLKILKDDEKLQEAAHAVYEVVLEAFEQMEGTN